VARFAGATALFALLTVVMTWPQAAYLTTHADRDQDVFFNMWRFGWVAHALSTAPARILDGNIFYPESRTLTLSDAMLVQGVIAAPLLSSGAPPVLVHNLMLLSGIVLSAAGIFMLALHLTGSRGAGVVAGIVFAFVPYRFAHYMHMELQWTVWVPWTFWALHRTFETGARRYGVMVGAFLGLQFLSSIYYGLFLATLLTVCALILLCATDGALLRTRISALALGVIAAAVLVIPYAIPYAAQKHQVGARSEEQVLMFSARPSSYVVSTASNYLYGQRSAPRARLERLLFPGVLPLLLAVAGLLLVHPSREAIMYLLGLVAAFEMSLGFYGYTFTFLYHHVPIFNSLRAPARLGIFVVFFLAVLAAKGYASLAGSVWPRVRPALLLAVCATLLLEYWVAPLGLVPFPNEAPPLYAWLAGQPPGVVAEFPMPTPYTLPGLEPRYAYMSTFHWLPTLNGYSGFYPGSYIARLDPMNTLPEPPAVEALLRNFVRYVIVHPHFYRAAQRDAILSDISSNPHFIELGRFEDGLGLATVFRLR
jgi:hypothetical protein